MWIRTGFDAEPGPAFVSMQIRIQEPIMRIQRNHEYPDPGRALKSQKLEFSHEYIHQIGNRKAFLQGRKEFMC